jgi:hypothetical protein
MKSNKKIIFLMENGLSINTISKMTDNQVKVLVEKFKKSEEKEAFEKVTIPSQTQLKGSLADLAQTGVDVKDGNVKYDKASGMVTVVTKEGEMTEDATVDDLLNNNEFGGNLPVNDNNPQNVGTPDLKGKNDGMPTTEGEIKEKFQSKSQQGLFWARCNKCSDKKCKWCKMAKEFSDSTSKKDYKKMPEKKRPEKTNESSQKYWENKILEMLEEEKKRRKKTPKKESETMILRNPKKMTMFSNEAPMELPIAKMFSIGKK